MKNINIYNTKHVCEEKYIHNKSNKFVNWTLKTLVYFNNSDQLQKDLT
jgi:hypothetical protein